MNERPENRNRPQTIYALRCKANGKVYIGKTGDALNRIAAHFQEINRVIKYQKEHPGHQFGVGWYGYTYDALEYGKEGFEVWILEENLSPTEAEDREAYYIRLYKDTEPAYGYNKSNAQRPRPIAVHNGLPPNLAKGEKETQ